MSDTAINPSATTVPVPGGGRGRRVRVVEVIDETADAKSIVIAPRPEDAAEFAYTPGQFLTVRVPDSDSGGARCYSLASSPHADAEVKFTVKRVAGGHGSNWLCDTVRAGDELEVIAPGGTFGPQSLADPVVLIAGGSGITPVISIAKSVLHGGSAEVLLVYANRDERSVIFASELRTLSERFAGRLTVVHILESVQGYPTREGLTALLGSTTDRSVYVCGPEPLMDLAVEVCHGIGYRRDRVHSERFVSLHGNPFDPVDEPEQAPDGARPVVCTVQVDLDGARSTVEVRSGQKLLDAFLEAGLDAPFSCREGACSACVCLRTSGEVRMARNEILGEEDVAEGYILACQSEPVSATIDVEY